MLSMKISFLNLLYSTLALAILQGSLYAFEPQIKLTGRKDLVLSKETRETVLKVGLTYLTKETDEVASEIEELSDPFAFEASKVVVPVAENNTEEEPEPVAVNYDDATVLAASAASFAKRVRGSITRGETSFLQLEGGTLLKPGTSFPVRLPQAKEQTFMLTITEITSQGYTLKIGEATQTLTYGNSPQSGSNSVQFTNP
jgi:hypothetical protein